MTQLEEQLRIYKEEQDAMQSLLAQHHVNLEAKQQASNSEAKQQLSQLEAKQQASKQQASKQQASNQQASNQQASNLEAKLQLDNFVYSVQMCRQEEKQVHYYATYGMAKLAYDSHVNKCCTQDVQGVEWMFENKVLEVIGVCADFDDGYQSEYIGLVAHSLDGLAQE
jgi:hypothetical protein